MLFTFSTANSKKTYIVEVVKGMQVLIKGHNIPDFFLF